MTIISDDSKFFQEKDNSRNTEKSRAADVVEPAVSDFDKSF